MKIKDITEGWGNVVKGLAKDFVGQDNWNATAQANQRKRDVAQTAQAQAQARIQAQAQGQFKSNPARTPATPDVPDQSTDQVHDRDVLTPGLTIASSSPVTFKYKKDLYRLNPQHQWVILGRQVRLADPAMQDFLNTEALKL